MSRYINMAKSGRVAAHRRRAEVGRHPKGTPAPPTAPRLPRKKKGPARPAGPSGRRSR